VSFRAWRNGRYGGGEAARIFWWFASISAAVVPIRASEPRLVDGSRSIPSSGFSVMSLPFLAQLNAARSPVTQFRFEPADGPAGLLHLPALLVARPLHRLQEGVHVQVRQPGHGPLAEQAGPGVVVDERQEGPGADLDRPRRLGLGDPQQVRLQDLADGRPGGARRR
jgi:hypothetical protein